MCEESDSCSTIGQDGPSKKRKLSCSLKRNCATSVMQLLAMTKGGYAKRTLVHASFIHIPRFSDPALSGCRAAGFNAERPLRDGIRGFYVQSALTHRFRWLHPKEAALLCGLDPEQWWPADLRAGLCLVGQCASPLQASWIGAHLVETMRGTTAFAPYTLHSHRMWLLRQAHGMIQVWV